MIHSGGSGEVEARWEQRVHRGAERPSAVMTVVHGRTKSTSDYKQRVACLSKSFPPLCNCSHGLSYYSCSELHHDDHRRFRRPTREKTLLSCILCRRCARVHCCWDSRTDNAYRFRIVLPYLCSSLSFYSLAALHILTVNRRGV